MYYQVYLAMKFHSEFSLFNLSNFVKGNELTFNYKNFDKEIVKRFIDYCYGIENCMDDLDIASTLELRRLLFLGTDWRKWNSVIVDKITFNPTKDGKTTYEGSIEAALHLKLLES